jgi:DeoR/GlpR family transcriptional regulator of sugar metabolism
VLQNRARQTVVLADATKFSRVALARVCTISEVDVLITDDRAPQAQLDGIRDQGCEVICV